VTAGVMATNLDVRFEETLARSTSLPAVFVDPTRSLESSTAVQKRLASLRPPAKFAARSGLPNLGPAPEFTHTEDWFNTPADRPLTLAGLRGHVVLVDFWTYTCINCLRTLPFLEGLYSTYHRSGLQIVGVETPEFTFEQEASNVRQAIQSDGIRYPVVQDNGYGTWNAYQNQYWPAEYLIDARGNVRHVQFGEGDYKQGELAVRALLREAGTRHLPPPMTATAKIPSAQLGTPETYLDDERAQGFAQPLKSGVHFYPGVITPARNEFALHGTWRITSQSAMPLSGGATIQAGFQAADVYLVLTSAGNIARSGRVLLDGRPISATEAGADVHTGLVDVRGQRLYSLVALPRAERHALTIELPPGVSAYDFTFG
jgi:thiol-disulfide isomerase/thioredoxin